MITTEGVYTRDDPVPNMIPNVRHNPTKSFVIKDDMKTPDVAIHAPNIATLRIPKRSDKILAMGENRKIEPTKSDPINDAFIAAFSICSSS